MSLLTKLTDIPGLRRQMQAATTSVTQTLGQLREAITAKTVERDSAQNGPLPPGEVIARFEAWVDEVAQRQRKEYGVGLVIHRFGAPPGAHISGSPWAPSTEVTWGFAVLFFGDMLKAQFAELVRQTEYTPAPALAERAAVVARLERELAEVETTEEALVDEMNANGIMVAHRPEVTQRREAERRRREQAERSAADRRARERAIDQRHAIRTGGRGQ